MTSLVTARTAIDVYVSTVQRAVYGTARLNLSTTSQAFMYLSIPTIFQGSDIQNAKLILYAGGDLKAKTSAWPTFTVKKLTSEFNASNLSWATRPTMDPTIVATANAPADQASGRWEWDLTDLVRGVISGEEWYGIAIESNSATPYWFNSSWSNQPGRLEMGVTSPVRTPTDLTPRGGQKIYSSKPVLSWNFTAVSTTGAPYAKEVEISASPSMTSPWSTGVVLGPSSTLDLATTAYAGAPANSARFWRVRVQTTDGLWSDWSQPASFTYTPSGVLTITSPAGSSTPDPTPTITWTFTGATQEAFQIVAIDNQGITRHDSGLVYTVNKTYTLPTYVYRLVNESLTLIVRVWDTDSLAQANGANTAYREVRKVVQWIPEGTVPPTALSATKHPVLPTWTIYWVMPTTDAQYFIIYRKREADGPEVSPSVVGYVWRNAGQENKIEWTWNDYLVGARSNVTWWVQPVRQPIGAAPWEMLPSATVTVRNRTPWLIPADPAEDRRAIALANADIDPGLSDVTNIVEPINGPAFVVYHKFNRYKGTCAAVLASEVVPDLPAEEMKQHFLWMRKNPRCILVWADEAIECFIFNCTISPLPRANGSTDYVITFGFLQTKGDLDQ